MSKKPHMIKCDVTTLKIFLKHIQPLNDKISGLKIKVSLLEKKIEELEQDKLRMEADNAKLAERLTEINHDNENLRKQKHDLIHSLNDIQGADNAIQD